MRIFDQKNIVQKYKSYIKNPNFLNNFAE